MKREIRNTADGSHTLFIPEMDECYHSIHGALQESIHVFINQGLKHVSREEYRILELGFGTGLNALLTHTESMHLGSKVHYHSVEKYPLEPGEYRALNFESLISGAEKGALLRLHDASWDQRVSISDHFSIYKERSDFRSMNPTGTFNLVYFDAFDPNKQPQLWGEEIFRRIAECMEPGGILVTYSSKGSVRRALSANGFSVEKPAGPPGKREMVRATF